MTDDAAAFKTVAVGDYPPRLTKYRTWRGPNGETLDGTNNSSERGIGWWIEGRYRTMRGYKRPQSAVNVSRLLAWCGNHLDRGGGDLYSPGMDKQVQDGGQCTC